MTIRYIKNEASWLAAFFHAAYTNCLLKTKTNLNKSNMCVAIVEYKNGEIEKYYAFSTMSNIKDGMHDFYVGNVKHELGPEFYDYFPISRGTRIDAHTEIQLMNYLYFTGSFSYIKSVTYISTRPICGTCISGLKKADLQFPVYGFDLGGDDHGISDYVKTSDGEKKYNYKNVNPNTDDTNVALCNILDHKCEF